MKGSQEYSPGEQLLIYASKPEEHSDKFNELVQDSIDWEKVINQAWKHGLTAHIYNAFKKSGSDVIPENVMDQLEGRYKKVSADNLYLTGELHSLIDLFDEYGFRVLPYRGPVLGSILYDDVTMRRSTDLDFLVRQSDIQEIKSVLLSEGFEPSYLLASTNGLTSAQEWAYTRYPRDYPFVRNSDGVNIELHWRIVSVRFPASFDFEMLWNRRSMVGVEGRDVPTFSVENRFVAFCIHGSRHRWERLGWLYDLDALVRMEETDWGTVVDLARDKGAVGLVSLGVYLVNDLFGTELPPELQDLVHESRGIPELAEDVKSQMFSFDESWEFVYRRFEARMLDGWRDKVSFWLKWGLYPDRKDIERYGFPKYLTPLYFVTRPVRKITTTVKKRPW